MTIIRIDGVSFGRRHRWRLEVHHQIVPAFKSRMYFSHSFVSFQTHVILFASADYVLSLHSMNQELSDTHATFNSHCYYILV